LLLIDATPPSPDGVAEDRAAFALKAFTCWVRIAFQYTDKGPEGLVKGKKAYLVLARR